MIPKDLHAHRVRNLRDHENRAGIIIGAMRRNPSTVVVLAGQASEGLLAAVGRSMNVSLVRPEEDSGGLEAAADALRRAAGIASPYVLVAADPLAAVAARSSKASLPPATPAGSHMARHSAATAASGSAATST